MSFLEIKGLVAGYNRNAVLHEIDFDLDDGQLLTVIGANGAGKSTLMCTIAGLVRPMAGKIVFDGVDLSRASAESVTRHGIAHVPENRRVFAAHTVEENLMLGAYARGKDRKGIRAGMQDMFESFPVLEERRRQPAGALSGGEQQMLAIAMALMARPRLLMLDEPSLGLAPIIIQQVFNRISALKHAGTTILLNEQLADKALAIADRGIVLHLGHVIAEGDAAALRNDAKVKRAYLGS
jgi:branched-chain amino acid transport system ATP-binding protein